VINQGRTELQRKLCIGLVVAAAIHGGAQEKRSFDRPLFFDYAAGDKANDGGSGR
jgi:hypothetical protein